MNPFSDALSFAAVCIQSIVHFNDRIVSTCHSTFIGGLIRSILLLYNGRQMGRMEIRESMNKRNKEMYHWIKTLEQRREGRNM